MDREAAGVDTRPRGRRGRCADVRPRLRGAAASRPVLGYFAGELVSEDDLLVGPSEAVIAESLREVRPFIAAVARVEVRSADPRAQDPQANLPALWDRFGPV